MDDDERAPSPVGGGTKFDETHKTNGSRLKKEVKSATTTPTDSKMNSRSPSLSPDQAKFTSDSASTPDNGGSAAKLVRKASQKKVRITPQTFDHLPDVTDEACRTFQVINDCLYGSRNMGATEHDALDCDCAEEWRTLLPLSVVVFPPCHPLSGPLDGPLARRPPPNMAQQVIIKTMPAVRIRTALTGRPRWSALTEIVIVEMGARTRDSNGSSMPTYR